MPDLSENGMDAWSSIKFHRHTANGSAMTLEHFNVTTWPDRFATCVYSVRVRDSRGVDRTSNPNLCIFKTELNFAVDTATGIVTVRAWRNDNFSVFSQHNLSVRDFCSKPSYCKP
jgi:hypothetical protein